MNQQDWQQRHIMAFAHPNHVERPLVYLCKAINDLINRGMGDDGTLRDGVAELIEGTHTLLDAGWGESIDQGSVSEMLDGFASRIGYDLASSTFQR